MERTLQTASLRTYYYYCCSIRSSNFASISLRAVFLQAVIFQVVGPWAPWLLEPLGPLGPLGPFGPLESWAPWESSHGKDCRFDLGHYFFLSH
jgi:hypothetical protein